jgi:hypothetical protein
MKMLILAVALLAAVPVVPAAAMPGDPPFVNGIVTTDCRKLHGYEAVMNWLADHPDGQDSNYAPNMIALTRAIIAEHPGLTPVEVLRRCYVRNPERIWSLALSYTRRPNPTSPPPSGLSSMECLPDGFGGMDCDSID